MGSPLVSVIVPAYNHERYVAAALDSVAAQSHRALELIVIEDRSTDATADVAARWCEAAAASGRFERVQFARNESNSGAHASLNRGLAAARGEYFCLLNSDDYYAPGRIAAVLERMTREGARFGFSAVMPVDDAGRASLDSPLARRIVMAREEIAALPSVSFGFLFRQLAVSTGNFVMHRSLYEGIGGFSALRYCHDWDYALRAFMSTEPVFVDQPLYFYRIHPSNSFAALGDVARQETEAVLRAHYARCLTAVPANDRAPTPYNWPGVFEHYVSFFELEFLWERTRRQHGAAARFRPSEQGPPRLSRYAAVDDNEPGASWGASARQAARSLRRVREKGGWRSVPRALTRALRLWSRAGT